MAAPRQDPATLVAAGDQVYVDDEWRQVYQKAVCINPTHGDACVVLQLTPDGKRLLHRSERGGPIWRRSPVRGGR